jgi:hypothetical protein
MKTTLTLLNTSDACLFTSVIAETPRGSSDTFSKKISCFSEFSAFWGT